VRRYNVRGKIIEQKRPIQLESDDGRSEGFIEPRVVLQTKGTGGSEEYEKGTARGR